MSIYVQIVDHVNQEKKYSMSGQMSLFDLVGEEEKADFQIRMPDVGEYAEENLLALKQQEIRNSRKLLNMELFIGFSATVSCLIMVFAACFATEILWWRIGLLGAALVLLAAGIAVAVKLERDAGYYECPHCHTRYVPTLKAVVFAPHLGRSRKMKCPYCGNKGYHKKVLEP